MGMFDDLFSSSRGAGVIGTLLALVILVGFGSLYMFVFDEGLQGGAKSIESVIRDQDSQILNLKARIVASEDAITKSVQRQKDTADVLSVERQIKYRDERLTELAQQKQTNEKAISDLESSWEQYKAQYRVAERARAVGEKFPELVTKSGKTYKSVTITKFDDLRMSIMSETGSKGIEWSELPDEMVDRFQFTKELAQVKVKQENAVTADMTTAAKAFQLKESVAFKKNKLQEDESNFQQKANDVSQSNNRIQQHENEIGRLRSLIAVEANKKGVRKTPFYEAQVRDLHNKIETERNKISAFATTQQSFDASRAATLAEIAKLEAEIQQLERPK